MDKATWFYWQYGVYEKRAMSFHLLWGLSFAMCLWCLSWLQTRTWYMMPAKHWSSGITLPSHVEGRVFESPHPRWTRGFFEQNLQGALRGVLRKGSTLRRTKGTRRLAVRGCSYMSYEDYARKLLIVLWRLLRFMGVHQTFHSSSWEFLSPAMAGVSFPTRGYDISLWAFLKK